jgi:FdhE protein
VIGGVAQPPFVRLPEPATLFAMRSRRFANLATGSELAPYLNFLAALTSAQHAAQTGLPKATLPEPEALARARESGMPPLDRRHLLQDDAIEAAFARFLPLAEAMDMPDAAARALARVQAAGPEQRARMLRNVLDAAIPAEAMGEHVYVAAVVQFHLARLAAELDPATLVPVGDGACPACGGPPLASLVMSFGQIHAARYIACALCGTLWNYVRVRCTLCGTTEGIGYQEIEGGPGLIKAETCERCRAYVKIIYQHKDTAMDAVADDVASLGLDLLMREGPYRRAGFNAFLIGY